jgi:hypothetical protein
MELEACCASSIHPTLHNSHTPCQLRLIAAWATDVSGCALKSRTTQMPVMDTSLAPALGFRYLSAAWTKTVNLTEH